MALLNKRPQLRALEDKSGLRFEISDVGYLDIHVHIAYMVWIILTASEATTASAATIASKQPQRSNLISVSPISYVTMFICDFAVAIAPLVITDIPAGSTSCTYPRHPNIIRRLQY